MNNTLVVVGVILLLLSLPIYTYTVRETNGYVAGLFKSDSYWNPYRVFSLPFFVAGLALIVVGLSQPDPKFRKRDRLQE